MSLKNKDLKKLWARSGNVCSFPECPVELVREKKANRVIGEEAHIKGEKPKAPRYDPSQTEAERESYENRILLCPTHHTEIDSDEQTWTVERLLKMKANHERQVIKNRQFPEFLSKVAKLLQAYQINDEPLDFSVSEVVESTDSVTIRIDASKEGGVNTTLQVKVGQRIAFLLEV